MNAVIHNQSREHTHKLAFSHTRNRAILEPRCPVLLRTCLSMLAVSLSAEPWHALQLHCGLQIWRQLFFTISYTLYETSLNDQMRTCCEEIHRNIAWMAGLQILCIESIPYSWFILGKLNWQKESDPISHVHETSWKHLGTVDLGNHIGFVGTSSLKFDT